MKYFFNITLVLFSLVLMTQTSVAGDKPKPLRDLPPSPTKTSVTSVVSTVNDATIPIELISPEKAIDQAIHSPRKEMVKAELEDTTHGAAVEKKIIPPAKSVHKAKKRKHYKKRHTRVKQKKTSNSLQNPVSAIDESIAK